MKNDNKGQSGWKESLKNGRKAESAPFKEEEVLDNLRGDKHNEYQKRYESAVERAHWHGQTVREYLDKETDISKYARMAKYYDYDAVKSVKIWDRLSKHSKAMKDMENYASRMLGLTPEEEDNQRYREAQQNLEFHGKIKQKREGIIIRVGNSVDKEDPELIDLQKKATDTRKKITSEEINEALEARKNLLEQNMQDKELREACKKKLDELAKVLKEIKGFKGEERTPVNSIANNMRQTLSNYSLGRTFVKAASAAYNIPKKIINLTRGVSR